MRILLIFLLTFPLTALQYQAPAGERKAAPRPGAVSVLPGGRMLHPFGRQYATGPGPFGLTINANGTIIVTANGGPDSFSLTVLHKDNKQRYTAQHVAVGDIRHQVGVDKQFPPTRRGAPIAARLHHTHSQRQIQLTDQVGQQDDAAGQDPNDRQWAAFETARDLAGHVRHTVSELFFGQ